MVVCLNIFFSVVTEAILVNPEIPTTPKKKDQTGEGPEGMFFLGIQRN